MKIPKIIHQTFQSEDKLSEEIKENIEALRQLNPDWKYVFYSDNDVTNFINDNYPKFIFELYNKINPLYGAARADFFRYLLMYKIGGVYIDIKSSIKLPLSQSIKPEESFLLSHWGQTHEGWGKYKTKEGLLNEFQQWHIIAEPNHTFLKQVIMNVIWNIIHYDYKTNGFGKFGVLNLTGPIVYTKAINLIKERASYSLVDIEEYGFKYSNVSNKGLKSTMPIHYSELTEPIIFNIFPTNSPEI
jgi:mannosyltransferase OCH1-like enzyme